MDNLFVSTSNGIYMLDLHSNEPTTVLNNKHTPGLFKKRSKGFFGICAMNEPHKLLVSSRERLSLRKHNKPTTDTKLFTIDTKSLEYQNIATIRDVHDAHQICCLDQNVFITDTGKNRVVVYNLPEQKVIKYINIGPVRDDIHHINAVLVIENTLLIGLNNRGRESQILHFDLSKLTQSSDKHIDAMEHATIDTIHNVSHSHDLEPCGGDILCCSSHKGMVVNTKTSKAIIQTDMWVRGLAATTEHLWVGASFIASRKERHGKEIDGTIHQYRRSDWSLIQSHVIKGSGQINDLVLG